MEPNHGAKRPWCVTILGLLVLLLGSGLNLVRAIWSVGQFRALLDLHQPTESPLIWLGATSLVWSLIWAICGVGLLRLREWARMATLAAIALYHASVWLNHVWFDRSDYALQFRPLSFLNTLLVVGAVWLFLNYRPIRILFNGQHALASSGETE